MKLVSTPNAALNAPCQREDGTECGMSDYATKVRPLLGQKADGGKIRILVGHAKAFLGATYQNGENHLPHGISPEPGDSYVIQPTGGITFQVLAKLSPRQWEELSKFVS